MANVGHFASRRGTDSSPLHIPTHLDPVEGGSAVNPADGGADLVLTNGKIATLDSRDAFVEALAVRSGRIVALGSDAQALARRSSPPLTIDVGGRTVVPGLSDTHIHFVREGRHYLAELRWDGVRSLADALQRLRDQAGRTPSGQWVRVVGGWSDFQFAERRVPTATEIAAAAPNTPALVLHLYQDATLNPAGLSTQKIGPTTAPAPAGTIERDPAGGLTGRLLATPSATILYAAVAGLPALTHDQQVVSTLHFARELNRFGLTSVVDAGGGWQFYPEDYAVATEIAQSGRLTIRVAYNLFTQRPGHELEDYQLWARTHAPAEGDAMFRINGAGETLVYSAADYENFAQPRPVLEPRMEEELRTVVRFLVQQKWPFRLHATYGESIERFLNVFEEVNDRDSLHQVRWFFDHAETVSDRDLDRIHRLGGGISIQDRMAFQGEYCLERYGESIARDAPPIAKMLAKGIPVGGGTDATRVASYNPWINLEWLVTGRTIGGTELARAENRLSRSRALRLVTSDAAWFSSEEGQKGSLQVGQYADFAVLSADYFSVPDTEIHRIESVLTVVGGHVVYASGPFAAHAPPPLPPIEPSWSPVAVYGGYPPLGSGAAATTARPPP